MGTIRNIIFDLGGVLLNVDYHKTAAAFRELGIENFDDFFSQFRSNELFEELETGKIPEEGFYSRIAGFCKPGTTIAMIESAWNAMLLSFRTESVITLGKLKSQYNTFLLSNTNSIHIRAFKKIFTAETGMPLLDTFFHKAYYSHEIGLRKPHPEPFLYVLEDAGILADETLFIDDSLNNIETAKRLGIYTHLLLPDERIENLFS